MKNYNLNSYYNLCLIYKKFCALHMYTDQLLNSYKTVKG